MKQFWSLTLMILAGCLLILGSEYSLQGDYRHYRHRVVAKLDYNAANQQATVKGRTKHGVVVTLRTGRKIHQVISNKQDGRFVTQFSVKGHRQIKVQVPGVKTTVLPVPVASKR